jgi:hypothetical protein
MADTWINAPVLVLDLPACPRCHSIEYRPVKGWLNDDGSRVSRRVCRACKEPYIVVRKKPLTPKLGGDNSR